MVQRGQTLFRCKKTEGINYTAPVAGKVIAINRGKQRAFQSLVLARTGAESQIEFTGKDVAHPIGRVWLVDRPCVPGRGPKSRLRRPPFPAPSSSTPMESAPLAPNPAPIIDQSGGGFQKWP